MLFPDHPVATGQHDGFVIATYYTLCISLFVATEITTQRGSTKLVIECSPAQWSFQHDVQGRCNSIGFPVGVFPWLDAVGDVQVGNGKSGQARLGFGAPTGRCFIANFASGTG